MMEKAPMRMMIAALVGTLMLAVPLAAQTPGAYVIPSVPAPRDPLPRFTIAPRGGFPVDTARGALPPIGLPLPPIGLTPPPMPGEAPRVGRHREFYSWPMMVFYVPQPIAVPVPLSEPASKAVEPPAPGRLILDVQPATAQVYADGYYVGVPADFSAERGGGVLDPGLHRIDVSADGYEPASVDVRVVSGQPVTYRASLKALPPAAAIRPTTFYLIPGCYMGNIPPQDAKLPASCDQSRTLTWRP